LAAGSAHAHRGRPGLFRLGLGLLCCSLGRQPADRLFGFRVDPLERLRELVRELPTRGADEATTRAVSDQVTWFDRAWYSAAPFDAERTRAFLEASASVVAQILRFKGNT
jgi:hypothetical protein